MGPTRSIKQHRHAWWPISTFGLASVSLFVLVAAHVLHLPVLAHDERAHAEPTYAPELAASGIDGSRLAVYADEPPVMAHGHGLGTSSPDRGGDEARLDHRGDDAAECMVTTAVIPTQAATPDAQALPAEIPPVTADGLLRPLAAVVYPGGPTRRHLLFGVLLR